MELNSIDCNDIAKKVVKIKSTKRSFLITLIVGTTIIFLSAIIASLKLIKVKDLSADGLSSMLFALCVLVLLVMVILAIIYNAILLKKGCKISLVFLIIISMAILTVIYSGYRLADPEEVGVIYSFIVGNSFNGGLYIIWANYFVLISANPKVFKELVNRIKIIKTSREELSNFEKN